MEKRFQRLAGKKHRGADVRQKRSAREGPEMEGQIIGFAVGIIAVLSYCLILRMITKERIRRRVRIILLSLWFLISLLTSILAPGWLIIVITCIIFAYLVYGYLDSRPREAQMIDNREPGKGRHTR